MLVDCRGLESALKAVRVSVEAVRVSVAAVRVSIEALRCLRGCERLEEVPVYRLHTAFLHWPLSSAATKEVQGPDTT